MISKCTDRLRNHNSSSRFHFHLICQFGARALVAATGFIAGIYKRPGMTDAFRVASVSAYNNKAAYRVAQSYVVCHSIQVSYRSDQSKWTESE
ncbi:hypothetical protein BDV10DRAFT_8638 [Aspergillus recurvatus]